MAVPPHSECAVSTCPPIVNQHPPCRAQHMKKARKTFPGRQKQYALARETIPGPFFWLDLELPDQPLELLGEFGELLGAGLDLRAAGADVAGDGINGRNVLGDISGHSGHL